MRKAAPAAATLHPEGARRRGAGRLALALHAHLALGVVEAEVAGWLDAWLGGL